ncbi:MAG: hypothetical protein ABSG86_16095 [Thermoguttaceae bacterium]|jgi:hypothetical protein
MKKPESDIACPKCGRDNRVRIIRIRGAYYCCCGRCRARSLFCACPGDFRRNDQTEAELDERRREVARYRPFSRLAASVP